MKKSFTLNHFYSALAFATLTLSTAHANYSQVIIFGDSLSDTGRIKDTVHQVAPSLANNLQPSFTTNPDPVWTTVLANHYGNTAKPFTQNDPSGTNFAVGGARSGSDIQWNGVIKVPSTSSQIKEYIVTTKDGKADPNALYAVWIGSNDLIAVSQILASAKSQAEGLSQAQTVIADAVSKTANDVITLDRLGAKAILVPSIPDLSHTPRAINFEELQAGSRTQAQLASSLYNRGLYSILNKSNANVIPANTFTLLQEVAVNKEAFGFKNITGVACQMPPRTPGADDPASTSLGCTSNNLIESNANETYAFADDIHPSGRTHRILAQYYQSIINAPKDMGKLPQNLLQTATINDRHLYQQLDKLDSQHGVWANIHTNDGKPLTQIGLDIAGANSHTGAYLTHQNQKYTPTQTLNADVTSVGAGIYHRHNFGKIHLNSIVGIDRSNIDTTRQIAWEGETRSHTADVNARRFYGGVQVGYDIKANKIQIRPKIGVHAQKIDMRAFSENQPKLSTAMQFGKQQQNSLQGDIGFDINYPMSDKLTVLGGVTHIHEFKNNEETLNASLTSIPEYTRGFNTTITSNKTHATTAHIGLQTTLGKTNVHTAIHATHQNNDTDIGGSLGVKFNF